MRANYKINEMPRSRLVLLYSTDHSNVIKHFLREEDVRRRMHSNRKYSNEGKDCDQCCACAICPLSIRKALPWDAFKIYSYICSI